MRLGDLREVLEALDQREARAQIHVQRLPHLDQRPVRARLDEHPVERDVVADERAQIAVPRGRAHRVDLGAQRRGPAGEPRGRELGGELLERGAHRVALGDLVGAQRPHASAAERLGFHEPQDLELAQRLSHRALADAELLGDPQLDEALTRVVVALEDALHEQVLDLLAKDRAVHRHGVCPCRRRDATGMRLGEIKSVTLAWRLSIMYAHLPHPAQPATGGEDRMLTQSIAWSPGHA
jgi:hypothetical protein